MANVLPAQGADRDGNGAGCSALLISLFVLTAVHYSSALRLVKHILQSPDATKLASECLISGGVDDLFSSGVTHVQTAESWLTIHRWWAKIALDCEGRGVHMADWETISNQLWKALAQLDTDAVQAEVERDFRVALIGAPQCGKTALACALAGTPLSEGVPPELGECLLEFQLPLSVQDVSDLEAATLLILLLDATKGDYTQEVAAADYLSYLGRPTLVCYNKMDLLPVETRLIRGQALWRGAEIMPLSATEPATVEELLVPAVLDVLPEHGLVLARSFPLFRGVVTDSLVERAALVNATYASASGLAERVPMLRIPFSAEDIEVLSANQAAMTYRLALAYGLPFDWHESASALSQVVEPGELWKQLARRVLGLVPLWGLSSKVRVAYGGTVVVAAVLRVWYGTGQELPPESVRELCREAAARSRSITAELIAKAKDALPARPVTRAARRRPKLRLPRPRLARRQRPTCVECGRANPADAAFCAYCGASLSQQATPESSAEHQPEGKGEDIQQ